MKYLFVDIDGVLNCEKAYENYDLGRDEFGDLFYEPSRILLNKLILKTGAKIVISSTWRFDGFDKMKDMWHKRKMEGELVGVTPHLQYDSIETKSVPRGCEIEIYLYHLGFYHVDWNSDSQKEIMRKSGVESYVILDDDDDMCLNQKNHFVHVLQSPKNKLGFNEEYYNKALQILNKDIISLNYE